MSPDHRESASTTVRQVGADPKEPGSDLSRSTTRLDLEPEAQERLVHEVFRSGLIPGPRPEVPEQRAGMNGIRGFDDLVGRASRFHRRPAQVVRRPAEQGATVDLRRAVRHWAAAQIVERRELRPQTIVELARAILPAMTAVEGLPTSSPSRDTGDVAPRFDGSPRTEELPQICPYLATADGAWRSANPVRDHRCTAVAPPVPLALEKQRRLCLVAAHEDCATYLAAEAARGERGRRTVSARPIARMTPLILDQGRFDIRLPAFRADRPTGQAILVAVLAVAFVAILLARPTGGVGSAGPPPASTIPSVVAPSEPSSTAGGGGPSADPATPEPTPEPTTATEAPAATPVATSTPPPSTPAPTAAPTTSGETYRVKSGDTLVAIAARFGTTTRVLIRLNGIDDPSRLRVGQILKLP